MFDIKEKLQEKGLEFAKEFKGFIFCPLAYSGLFYE
jgi:hypothetical protein